MAKRYNSRRRVGGKMVRNAHYVWNKHHPNDKVKKGEVIHHKDGNKKNDAPSNLEKKTDAKHKSLHSHHGVKALTRYRKQQKSLTMKKKAVKAKRQ